MLEGAATRRIGSPEGFVLYSREFVKELEPIVGRDLHNATQTVD